MSDSSTPGQRSGDATTQNPVSTLASRALSVVATRTAFGGSPLVEEHVQRLHDAALGEGREDLSAASARLMRSGVRREDLVDFYIPEIARRMGAAWCEDDMSFASVTIGSARLQALLREVGAPWRADRSGTEGTILVVVGPEVYHTLGAMVLATQLRRFGFSVSLSIGEPADKLGAQLWRSDFDAILVSASMGETLESLRRIVEVIRSKAVKLPPIVLGGTITEDEADLEALTGADLATSDLSKALDYCGLTPKTTSPVPRT